MAERPILFSGEMVRAILDGRKTMTRRVVKTEHDLGALIGDDAKHVKVHANGLSIDAHNAHLGIPLTNPYGVPGDRLWVRETWADTNGESGPMISYRAGGDRFLVDESYPVDYSRYPGCRFSMWCGDLRRGAPEHPWRSPIHMPRWASRITLEITNVRVERVQQITADGCIAEGIASRGIDRDGPCIASALMYIEDYRALWDSLNAPRDYGWDANPWVWVIEFRRAPSGETTNG